MSAIPEGFVTAREAAKILPGGSTTQQTIARLCRDGRLPGAMQVQVGSRVRWIVPVESLKAYQPGTGRPRKGANPVF